MVVHQESFEVQTRKRTEAIDVTEKVEKIVEKSGIKNGVCLIFTPHATASIILEEAEEGLLHDIENVVKKIFPRGTGYQHDRIDDNADSHLASGFIGQSRIYPVRNGRILRGAWQQVLLLELDGPRKRKVIVTLIGNK